MYPIHIRKRISCNFGDSRFQLRPDIFFFSNFKIVPSYDSIWGFVLAIMPKKFYVSYI